jgi:hypothetical protein
MFPMKRDQNTLSRVREESPFATPPRVVVMADDDGVAEAVKLAEALDAFGAEAEVRFSGDASADRHSPPDAVIFAGTPSTYQTGRNHSVLIAVTDGEKSAAGYDLVVSRPVDASALLEQLGDYLPRIKM